MLQYFLDNKYHSIFTNNTVPTLEYICKVDASSSSMPRSMHMHSNIVEVLLVFEGNGLYIIERHKYTAKKGDLIFFNSKVLHDEFGGLRNGLATYCLGFKNLHLKNLEKDKIIADNCYPIISSGDNFPEFLHLMEMIQHNSQDKCFAEFCNHLALAFVIKAYKLIKQCSTAKPTKEHSLSVKIKEFIDANYTKNISLETIALAVKANRYYLSHTFKAATGFSPMQYVTRRRIGEAQNLLIHTDLSITDIALQVGYNNSNYFQNVFRQNVGLTPGMYRQKWKF